MANLDSENLKFMPVVKKKGNIYIDPPAISDAISTRFNKAHVTVTDLDKLAHRGGILQKLGCAIYQAKTNFVQGMTYPADLSIVFSRINLFIQLIRKRLSYQFTARLLYTT